MVIECLMATHKRDKRPQNPQQHPDVQAAVGPVAALLQQDDRGVQQQAAEAIQALVKGCKPNQSLFGAEPGAVSRLWQLTQDTDSWVGLPEVLVTVFRGHRANRALLVQQPGFMEDLLGLLASKMPWRFYEVATPLLDKKHGFVLKLCDIPTAVPMLVVGLDPTASGKRNSQLLDLLLCMTKARPSVIHTISKQSGVLDKLAQLSQAEQSCPTETSRHGTMLAMLLQLVQH